MIGKNKDPRVCPQKEDTVNGFARCVECQDQQQPNNNCFMTKRAAANAVKQPNWWNSIVGDMSVDAASSDPHSMSFITAKQGCQIVITACCLLAFSPKTPNSVGIEIPKACVADLDFLGRHHVLSESCIKKEVTGNLMCSMFGNETGGGDDSVVVDDDEVWKFA